MKLCVSTTALTLALALLLPAPGFPQGGASTPAIEKKAAPVTSAASGAEMFRAYCASCHGVSGKGDGPAAPALSKMPANLTLLASQNGGKYPSQKVEEILRHGPSLPAHGSIEMPTWGPALRAVSGNNDAVVKLRIANLNDYIRNLQGK